MTKLFLTPLLALPLTMLACGDKDDDTGETSTHTDGGTSDGGTADGGTADGGTSDGGTSDGGTTDGGTSDGGTSDGGTSDGGTSDGGTSDGGTTDLIEIAGTWTDGWGGSHQITDESWDQGSALFHISQYDNTLDFAIAQNDKDNKYSRNLWSRFDWTRDGEGGLWYCTTAYDAATEADALATPPANPSDPATGGCGSFAWTSMTPAR